MHVRMSRVLRPGPYESFEFSIELDESTHPREPEETSKIYLSRLTKTAYSRVLMFELEHRDITMMTPELVKQKLERFKEVHGI